MNSQISLINVMGILNVTPDSFSEKCFKSEEINRKIKDFIKYGVQSIDIGAESTAPFNQPVELEDEIERIEKKILPLFQDCKLPPNLIYSIDTYKIEVIKFFLKEISLLSSYKETSFIWNDVSGKINDGVKEILETYKKLEYVFSHNLCPTRKETSFHMDYIDSNLSIKSVEDYFLEGIFSLEKFKERIYIDLCFGFSKNKEQNYNLINNYHKFIKIHNQHIFGISRKSFLQEFSRKKEKRKKQDESEYVHQLLIVDMIKKAMKSSMKIFLRVHDPLIVSRSIKYINVFK